MKRRDFSLGLIGTSRGLARRSGLAGALAWLAGETAMAASGPATAGKTGTPSSPTVGTPVDAPWAALEAASGGRLGLAILDTGSGRVLGYRLDERFPMCSTFKWLASAAILARVDQGALTLDRRVRFAASDLVTWSPVTERRTGGDGMTLAEVCEAAITVSDNTAGNLILDTLGGPGAVTDYARTLGDTVTRLDRRELALNEARPGDPRDTTSPRAMAILLREIGLGQALAPTSRQQLLTWLEASSTNGRRLRADLPAGWRMGSKTGTGDRGTTNDVGIYWPPDRAPVIAAVYLTDTRADEAGRQRPIAEVARWIHARSAT